VQRVSAYENQFAETRKEKFHRVQHLRADSSDYDSDQDINVAEWTRNKKTVYYPWIREAPKISMSTRPTRSLIYCCKRARFSYLRAR
jgi:hypothetical protein